GTDWLPAADEFTANGTCSLCASACCGHNCADSGRAKSASSSASPCIDAPSCASAGCALSKMSAGTTSSSAVRLRRISTQTSSPPRAATTVKCSCRNCVCGG